jgi:PAS domain S-box-containing protein
MSRVEHDANDYLEGLMEGFVAYDADWRMTYMNASAERILGRERADVLGKTWHQAFPHAVGNPVDHMYQRVMSKRRGESMEYFYPHYGRWLEISASPVRTGGVGVYFRDISDRKRAEEALHESEARFRTLADSAPVMIWVNGMQGCEYVNHGYVAFAGLSERETLGFGWERIVHPEDREANLHAYLGAAAQRRGYATQCRLRRHDGVYRWMQVVGAPRFGPDGAMLGMAGVCVDVTDMKAAEQALREADRRKDEFLATLAHELRNPLAPIRNGLQVLQISKAGSGPARQALAIMERQVLHLVRLLDELMDLSRVTQGRVTLRREDLDLGEAVRAAAEASGPLIGAGAHRLELDLPPEPLRVNADPVRIAQVLANLLNNAAKYTPDGGRIALSVSREGERATIRVRDTGIGIPAEMLPRVFEKFVQVPGSANRSLGGLGIGLSLARTLVELHGGTIEARSEGEGKGAEFVVSLPELAA